MDFLASAGLGLLSSGTNFLFENLAHKRDRREALEDWNRQNEYNSPKNQMKRFQEAGLNPQLIYGQGTPGNASATPVSTQKSGNPSYKVDLMQIYGDAKRLEANLQQTQQTIENLKTNQELMQANQQLSEQLLKQREIEFPYKLDKTDATIYSLNSSADFKNKMLNPTIDNLTTRTAISKDKNAREERWLNSQLSLNSARTQQTIAQTALTTQMRLKTVEQIISQRNLNDYQRTMLSEGLRKIQAETENILQNKRTSMSVEDLNRINIELKNWENTYAPFDKTASILSRILSPFSRNFAPQKPVLKPKR